MLRKFYTPATSKFRTRTFVLVLAALTLGTIFWFHISLESMPHALFSLLSSQHGGKKDQQDDSQSNPELLQLIRKDFLKPPSNGKYGSELKSSKTESSEAVIRLHDLITKIFHKKTGGFFIECGAYEVNMTRVKDQEMLSQIHGNSVPKRIDSQNVEVFEAQCFPLFSILAAKMPPPIVVDYFSLDVESAELPIFKTIPWDQVYIKVISAEDDEFGSGPKIKKFLESKGYRQIDYIKGPWIHDLVFAHERFINEAGLQITKTF